MSKVIFKMTFKHPNLKDSIAKNMSHVGYIATRPGADKTITEYDLKKELEKGVEDLSSDDESYARYIDKRPNSHGLFGADGVEDPKEIQEELSEVNSFVWRGIVSLKETDAKNLGYMKKEQWQDMLRKKIPDMGSEMGIPIDNLRWVSAVHMEKGHPHAHIMVWEKEPQKTIGIVSSKSLDNIRKLFTDEIFEEERFMLMNEKNLMRDLINDLAKGDVSKATHILKEVKESGEELKAFMTEMHQEGITPNIYSEQEQEIAEMIEALSKKLPGKGRANLKFMSEEVKEDVRAIADYLLQQPVFMASLEKNLKAVEELTKMYTGKDDAIQKAKDNAYKDIRDRVSQVVLKGAVESLRENIFLVDQELSENAVAFIKDMNNQINLIPEQTKVIHQIATDLLKCGHEDNDILEALKDWTTNEGVSFSEGSIRSILDQIKDNGLGNQDVNMLSSSKKIDHYLSSLKIAGMDEEEAFKRVRDIIKEDTVELDERLNALKNQGFLKTSDEQYKLTNKGVEELLNVKELDQAEKAILRMLESDSEETVELSFEELIENKDIFGHLRNKDPDEFKVAKYDTRVRFEFGENNAITLKELEANLYKRYTDDELKTNTEKAEQEYDFLKSRIDKLVLNGYVELDKTTGIYSFTEETDKYFQYDEEKDTYTFTKEAIKDLGIPTSMEFTRYDANLTLGYIDQVEGGVLTADVLEKTLHSEIVNKTAETMYNKFNELLDTDLNEIAKKYIKIDDDRISSTESGKWLGIELNKLNKEIKSANAILKEKVINPDEYDKIVEQFKKHVAAGIVQRNEETGYYKIDPTIADINKCLYQLYKADGAIDRSSLKETLEKNVPNYEAEKQFKYLTWRLDNLKEDGYLSGEDKSYILTSKGIEKREDILVPERELLRKSLTYLKRLGLLEGGEDFFKITDRYYKYMNKVAIAKENKEPRESTHFTKDIVKLIDRTEDNINVGKIHRTNERITTGKYINNDYQELKTNYDDVRKMCQIKDTLTKTIKNLSTTLLVAGVTIEETKEILHNWNLRANNIDTEKLNEIIDNTHKTVVENNLWEKTTIISTSEWKEMFESLGVREEEIPKWMYKGENWQSFKHNMSLSVINDLWKNTWRELEKQRMQTEAQGDFMKKQLNKQEAIHRSKEAMKEHIRKNASRTLYKEDELER